LRLSGASHRVLSPSHLDLSPMFIVPIVLLLALIVVVISGNSMKKKGSMSENAYQNMVSVSSIIVTIAALAIVYLRMRG
jgi:hypothetical protein